MATDLGNGMVRMPNGALICCPTAAEPPVDPMPIVSKATEVPASVEEGTTNLYIDLDLSAEPFDVSTLAKPAGLAPGAMVQIRKTDKSKNAITFDDGVKKYAFRKCGDAICLQCDGDGGWCLAG